MAKTHRFFPQDCSLDVKQGGQNRLKKKEERETPHTHIYVYGFGKKGNWVELMLNFCCRTRVGKFSSKHLELGNQVVRNQNTFGIT